MQRIAVVVVAYNAASTLAQVLDRIPPDFRARIDHVYIGDNHSEDSTYLVGVGYQQAVGDLPITVVRHPRNLGYGGNQKAGYRWAIEQGFDIVVLLHGDGQYAPEFLPEIVAPLVRGECDAVFGSRLMRPGEARRGGMPLYKYVGNRILSTVENAIVGEKLSEWHSGYRAFSVAALQDVPFERNTDDYNFDSQIIIQFHEARKRIVELPIPTFYGDEICYVNGLGYARDCTIDALRYRAHKLGFGSGETAFASENKEFLEDDERVHTRILSHFASRPTSRILDLGCGDGTLGERLRALGHEVTGVDIEKHDGVGARLNHFVEADIEHGIPEEVGVDYDVALASDLIGYIRDPVSLLVQARARLRRGGSLIVSIPNFVHWYPRVRVATGRFDYDRRGILDRGHVRFFTRRSAERIFREAGCSLRHMEPVGLPVDMLTTRASGMASSLATRRWLHRIDRLGAAVAPSLFAYQFLYELESPAPR
jgi:glycosyltransferase involved in cell wall biosynthesis